MEILGLVFTAYNIVGTGFSIIGGLNHAINKYYKTTAEDLFRKSFVKIVKQCAPNFVDLTDPETIEVDHHTFDNVIDSLKNDDIAQLTELNDNEKLEKITTLFRDCIIVPNHQLAKADFDQRIRPIVESVIVDFYAQIPFNQGAFNQIVLKYIQNNIKHQTDAHTMLTELSKQIDYVRNEVTQRLSKDIKTIKDDTEKIKDDNKEIKQTTQTTYDLVSQFKSQLDLNTLEFDLNWFKIQFDKQKASIGEKFDSSLHTEIDVEIDIHAILSDHTFAEHLTVSIEKLEKELEDLNDAVDSLNKPIQKDIVWDAEKKDNVAIATKPLQDVLIKTIDQFKHAKVLLKKNMLFEAQAIDWDCVFKELEDELSTYRTAIDESNISEIEYTGESPYKARILDDTRWLVHRPESIIANLLDDFLNFELYKCKLINRSELKIFGNAGVGKTHIACNICEDRLNNRLPALFVRGNLFTDDQPIQAQLLKILDIPSSYSFNDFLKALSAAAEAYNTRIPLFIDGLNEATNNGTLSKVWQKYLKGFVYEIAQNKNVVLITTCRSSYKKVIWGDEYPPYSIDVEGFETDDVTQEAIKKYSKVYNFEPDLTLASLTQFKHPIYLKIYFETKKRSSNTKDSDYIGEQALFEIFDEYLAVCNKVICEDLNRHKSASIIQTELNKIAEYLWINRCRHIPFQKLGNIVDGKPLDELDWDSSKSQAILNEDLLVYRDWEHFGESVYFTYDLLGGYLIAKYLLEQANDDVQGFLNSEEVVEALFGEDHQTLHPMHEDISRCLAALIPSKTGEYLHNLSENIIAHYYSIRSLFEISPKYITDDCSKKIGHIFKERSDSRKPLLELAESTVGHPGHPFNAKFWTKRLSKLSMLERDLCWTEHVRNNSERFEKLVKRFEKTCKNDKEISEFSTKRLHLLAEHIMWILTSTVRPLRDKATRALYWYGRRFPKVFFELALQSFTINDPYISERMLAATYGIAMARQNDLKDTSFVDEMLPKFGKQLYNSMFIPNAPHATTHILARDYAKRTIDITLIHHPNLLTKLQRKYITPPFSDGGIRKWEELEVDDNMHRGPLRMDFRNYTIGSLVKGRTNYNFEHTEYKRVLRNISWRIHELGYSQESFGNFDGRIGSRNQHFGRSANGGKTDRYGKKYSWIAYFEYAGYLQDQDLLPEYYDHHRIGETDIDPSFPSEVNRYELVTQDYLGSDIEDPEEWINGTPPTDLQDYISVNQIFEKVGPWILLQGTFRQENAEKTRDMYAFFQGVIVKTDEVESIVEFIKDHEKIDGWRISPPEDYYTFAGEIPWCDTYPSNSWVELSISRDFDETYDTLIPQILPPVRLNNWEDYHSTIIHGQNVATPSRQIAECLDLCGASQTYDLFEKDNGKRASFSIEFGQKWGNTQRFTYLRKDLLDRYLKERGEELIWIIYGDRRELTSNADGPYTLFHDVKVYQRRQKDNE